MQSNHCYEILIVDDDPGIRNSLVRALSAEGRRLVTARGAGEAMQRLRAGSFDLIISDFSMPGMDGVELMEHAKRHYPDMLRIMLSAHSDRWLLMNAVNRGSVFKFVTKPWNDADLHDAVGQALDQCQAVRNHRVVQSQLEKVSLETVMALAETIELKDPYTKGHCSRVRDLSLLIARQIGLPGEMLPHLIYGSLLHDCGKIGIEETILLSQVPFDAQSRKIMETHPILGFQLTNKIVHLKTASWFIRQHHERWDGDGYPDGLKGEQIHPCSRIIAVADAFDAMTSDRPYHKGMPATRALEVLRANKNTQFDPMLVDAFIDAWDGQKKSGLIPGKDPCTSEHPPQIMLVDDEANVLKALVRCLADEGYQVVTAGSGTEALNILGQCRADIIVSDQRMPGMDGIEFLKKSSKLCPDAVRIMLSGHADMYADLEAVNKAGLYKLMSKPWDENELKHSLKNAMEWQQMVRRNPDRLN